MAAIGVSGPEAGILVLIPQRSFSAQALIGGHADVKLLANRPFLPAKTSARSPR